MKKFITLIACLALCACIIGTNVVMAADPTPAFIAAENGIEITAGASDDQIVWENFDVNLGDAWAISGEFSRPEAADGFQIIAAKGPKDAGHFEVYLASGALSMYFPDTGAFLSSTVRLDDGNTHAFCFTESDGTLSLYVDGAFNAAASVAAITPETETFYLGSVPVDGLPYTGTVKRIAIYNQAADEDLAKRLSTVGYTPAVDEPKTEAPAGDTVRDFGEGDALAIDYILADGSKITEDGNSQSIIDAKKSITANESVNIRGWFGSQESSVVKYGYTADEGATFVFDYDPIEPEQAVIDAGGDSRYDVTINVAGLKAKTTFRIVAKLENGTIVYLNKYSPEKDRDVYMTVEANSQAPVTEAPQTGDMTVAVFAVIAVTALAAIVVLKKRVNA